MLAMQGDIKYGIDAAGMLSTDSTHILCKAAKLNKLRRKWTGENAADSVLS